MIIVSAVEDVMRAVIAHRQRVGMEVEARTVVLLVGRRGINRFEDDGVIDQRLQAISTRIGRSRGDGEIASIHKFGARFAISKTRDSISLFPPI